MPADHAPLALDFLHQRLADCSVGHTILHHNSVPSTMPIAAALARDVTTPSGVVVVAEEQTAGRGRNQRTWSVPISSGLLTSIILKPPHYHLPASHAPMLAAIAVRAAVIALAPDLAPHLSLKWPNDLLWGSNPATAGKLCGILSESSLHPAGNLAYLILGIGINANQNAAELPPVPPPTPAPISLRLALGHPVDRNLLLAHLCEQLALALTMPTAESVRLVWRRQLGTLGQRVAVYARGMEQDVARTGRAVDVDATGALIVEMDDSTRHTFHAGDVSIRTADSAQ